jgi:3-deoxy-7-phosphoheptulonate synthase
MPTTNNDTDPSRQIADLRIARFEPLDPPCVIKAEIPATDKSDATVLSGRHQIRDALAGKDRRLAVIVGPCSIHHPDAAMEYAERLARLNEELKGTLLLVMRVYFEKPRTTIGWKGLINDPMLDGTEDINLGLRKARRILLDINELGIPCATEFVDPVVPQYTADLVAWSAVGARTTESQIHRGMASGLSMPVGFKNPTDGAPQIAIDAIVAARHPHSFIGIDPRGSTAVVRTTGNPDAHIVLRGGTDQPNYSAADVAFVKAALGAADCRRLILVDCSHGNSHKDYRRQPVVFQSLVQQRLDGEMALLGMMLESHLKEGSQPPAPFDQLQYGVSITDACIGWDATESLLREACERLSIDTL